VEKGNTKTPEGGTFRILPLKEGKGDGKVPKKPNGVGRTGSGKKGKEKETAGPTGSQGKKKGQGEDGIRHERATERARPGDPAEIRGSLKEKRQKKAGRAREPTKRAPQERSLSGKGNAWALKVGLGEAESLQKKE